MAPTPVVWIPVGVSTNGGHWSYPNTTTITQEGTVVTWMLTPSSQQAGWTLNNAFFTPQAGWPGSTPGAVVLPNSGKQYGFVVVDADTADASYNFQFTIQTTAGTFTSPDPQIVNDPPPPALMRRLTKT